MRKRMREEEEEEEEKKISGEQLGILRATRS